MASSTSTHQRHPHVVNGDELAWQTSEHGERFAAERKALGRAAAGRQIGASLYRIPPGKTAFPAHVHHANEEAVYVLAGEGALRLVEPDGEREVRVRPGDYVALPAGGPAHQLRCDGSGPLEYLCLSTMIHPEVLEYPDSDKVGAMAGAAPGGDRTRRTVGAFFPRAAAVGYHDGE